MPDPTTPGICRIWDPTKPLDPTLCKDLINWSTSELNRQLNPTTCLGDTDCWIQQVTAPTLAVTGWIQQCTCISHSSCKGVGLRPLVQIDGEMHVDCWIQQVTTRVGAVTYWIQQSLSPKQVVGFSCLFNSELTN